MKPKKTRRELAKEIAEESLLSKTNQNRQMNIFATDHKTRMSTREGHAYARFHSRKNHAKKNGIPFEITLDYALSIIVDECPILGIPLSWCESHGKPVDSSPSLDKIIPEKGYVEGNVAWISKRANTIKNDGTAKEHLKIAHWIKNNTP